MDLLPELTIDVPDGISNEALRRLALAEYKEYVAPGADGNRTHDGQTVLFAPDRESHAFRITPHHNQNARRKRFYDPARVARIRWIGPVIRRETEGVQCFEGLVRLGSYPAEKRLYYVRRDGLFGDEYYVVWLEPRPSGGFRFSSAYLARYSDVVRYKAGLERLP